ncbi:hypothetical protein [Flavobacterium sp. 38-13]|uniref:hypothetical protein n=2 Tax=Flavobacterium TaxID=237 RepID=UPI000AE2F0C3|nr:hypothetical protein [Flavobacterium sp. 38-13]
MENIIEIYTKLIIAIISFIAPLIIHLLSMFSEASSHIKRKADIELQQINELVKSQVQAEGAEIQKLMKESEVLYKNRAKTLKRQENILSPKRQISRIFPILFSSLIFVALYIAAEEYCWGGADYNLLIEMSLFITSLVLSTIGVVCLKIIAWTVIEIKEQLAIEKERPIQRVEKPENI